MERFRGCILAVPPRESNGGMELGDLHPPSADVYSDHPTHQPIRYLAIEDAAVLAGVTPARLRQLALRKGLPFRGGMKDPLFPVDDLLALRPADLGAPPDWLADRQERRPPRRPGRPARPPVFQPNSVARGNVLEMLPQMPAESVKAVVCSPPYWGQRVYAGEMAVRWGDGCLVAFGREGAPEHYVLHTLEILKGLLRVLRPDGSIWWNLADTYMTRTIMRTSTVERVEHYGGRRTRWAGNPHRRTSTGHPYLKDKDLSLVPFQIAIAAQKLGYYVRSIIVWSKQQPEDDYPDLDRPGPATLRSTNSESPRTHVPEIVADRPVTGHEYILLLTKSERYGYYPYASDGSDRVLNVRTVWTFRPVGNKGNHVARFPDELPRRCIRLGTEPGELVFDPFAGQGTTLRIARDLGRQYFGCDISARYVREARAALRRPPVNTSDSATRMALNRHAAAAATQPGPPVLNAPEPADGWAGLAPAQAIREP